MFGSLLWDSGSPHNSSLPPCQKKRHTWIKMISVPRVAAHFPSFPHAWFPYCPRSTPRNRYKLQENPPLCKLIAGYLATVVLKNVHICFSECWLSCIPQRSWSSKCHLRYGWTLQCTCHMVLFLNFTEVFKHYKIAPSSESFIC